MRLFFGIIFAYLGFTGALLVSENDPLMAYAFAGLGLVSLCNAWYAIAKGGKNHDR